MSIIEFSSAWVAATASMLVANLCYAHEVPDRERTVATQLALGEVPVIGKMRRQETHFKSPGKPAAPVDLGHEFTDEPTAGVPLSIDLTFASRIPVDALALEFNFPDDSLTPVTGSGRHLVLADVVPGESYSHRIDVLPREEGRFHVNVVATLVRDGLSQARAFSIPVRVGNVSSSAAETGNLKTDDTGRALLSMPATESGTGL